MTGTTLHGFGLLTNSMATNAGGTLVIPAEGFLIQDKEGPLKDGELERATSWAQQIVAKA